MAHDVFISHSTEDKPAADAICAILEENGVRCWIAPRDIMPGADWGESIVNGIRTSRVLLLVFSTNANKSKQIKREVEIAADGGLTIVPLRIENILPTESFKYFLGNIHWLDALTPPLERHLQEVAAKVKAILSTESVNSPEASQRFSPAKAPAVQPPARRNVIPVIGGIVVILIATSGALFFWKFAVSSVSPPSVVPTPPAVQPSPIPSPSNNGTVTSSSSPVSVVPTPPPVVQPSPIPSPPNNGTVVSSSVSPVSVARIEPASTPEASSHKDESISVQGAMILGILRAIETHDSRGLLAYTVDRQTDYFGHKNASTAFIQQDLEQRR